MANTQRHRSTTGEHAVQGEKRAGRPKGAPSTIVNVRLSLTLVAQLDRYLDCTETQTGQKENRGTIIRRVLHEFLKRHAADML